MKALKNKHSVVAMIVAPILAILAWFAIDRMVGETPHAAREGESYALVEMPSCRYNSGYCGLKNGDFRLDLTFEESGAGRILLSLQSEFSLDGVKLGVAQDGGPESRPLDLAASDESGKNWLIELDAPDPETTRYHLVASTQQTLYYGDVATKFMLPR